MTLVSRYKFESNGNDSAGSNNLTENGTPTYSATAGVNGQYVILNGSSMYLTAASSAIHDITTGDFTIACWIYLTSTPGDSVRIAEKITGARYTTNLSSTVKASLSLDDGTGFVTITGSTTLSANTWYHLAFVFDRDGNGVVYVNGASDGSGSIAAKSGSLTNIGTFTVGRAGGSSTEFFPGRIDDLRFYNHALSATEVSDLYSLFTNSAAGIDSVGDLDDLLTDQWNSANTDSRTPTITDNLQKAWEDVNFGTEDFIYVMYDVESVKTGLHADDFFHRISCSIEVVSPSYGDTDGRSHFNKVMKEVARIIKANPRQSGYAFTVLRNTRGRFNRDRNTYIGTVDVELLAVKTA